MKICRVHKWDVDYKGAVKIQNSLVARLKEQRLLKIPKLVAGADVSYNLNTKMVSAAVVVLSWPQLTVMEKVISKMVSSFPYIPGLLSFREGPALINAFKRVKHEIDLIFFDGQGKAHPRGLGIASHLGVWLDKPTIGCAKSRLVGEYREPGKKKGNFSKLSYKGKVVGTVVRTRTAVKPIFVSGGYKVTLAEATKYVLAASPKYRIPEPIRQAHMLAGE